MSNQAKAAARLLRGRRVSAQAGLSLLEVLFAAFLVATVAVFMAPLFMRAVASNIEGNESSSAINFDKTFVEQTTAIPINHNQLDVRQLGPAPPDPTVRRIFSMVYDTGPHDRGGGLERELGDEAWRVRVAADAAYAIERRWDFDPDLRAFSYFDIVDALVSSVDFATISLIVLGGDPDVFDNPLTQNIQSPFRHLKEANAQVASRREAGALGSSDRTDAAMMRAY